MDIWSYLFAKADAPDSLQMISRGVFTFLSALLIFRIGARRTFGKGTAVDNLVVIMLGGMLSRVVTGAAAYLPVMAATTAIIFLHRFISRLCMRKKISGVIMGTKKELYAEGKYNQQNMRQTMTGTEDLEEAIRLQMNTQDLSKVDKIFMERNGEISVIEK
jgi:uncharacterized membrane protein YcaP (DUF421 family)